jgi:hypothetical protein
VGDSLGGGGAERVHALLSCFWKESRFTTLFCWRYSLRLHACAEKKYSYNLKSYNFCTSYEVILKNIIWIFLDFRYRVNTINEFFDIMSIKRVLSIPFIAVLQLYFK